MEKRTTGSSGQPQTAGMYCNNCGQKGHLFRTCRDPILSCGLFLIENASLPIDVQNTRVLMIRRKDSMSFAEFMRGKYDPNDMDYLGMLMRNMTLKEQSLIACEPFDAVWKTLWGDDRNSSDYAVSRDKFNSLDRVKLMADNLSTYTEPEWGFPKGRRMRGETDLECAIREFGEETNIPREAYVVLKNIHFDETFVGLNGIRYRHVYYVALLKHPEMVNLTQKFTPMQRREISGIGWKTFPEAEALIRPHHIERPLMLNQLQSTLELFETD
jgi:8-oxo-dGTP pyrophosphatase MutT (NUDIX family)